jgi:hypothetical protein
VQQNGHVRANVNSATRLNADIPGPESILEGPNSCHSVPWIADADIQGLTSLSMHRTTVEPEPFKTSYCHQEEASWHAHEGVSSCITMPVPMWSTLSRTCCIPCAGPSPYRPDLSLCDFHWPLHESAKGLQIRQRCQGCGGAMVPAAKGFICRGDMSAGASM